MTNVINLNSYSYLKERADAVLIMWNESEFGGRGWIKVAGTDDLAETVLALLESTPSYQIGIKEVGWMTPDMEISDFYGVLAQMACETGENEGWFKINRESAEATVRHLIDLRENPIHLDDFYPQD